LCAINVILLASAKNAHVNWDRNFAVQKKRRQEHICIISFDKFGRYCGQPFKKKNKSATIKKEKSVEEKNGG